MPVSAAYLPSAQSLQSTPSPYLPAAQSSHARVCDGESVVTMCCPGSQVWQLMAYVALVLSPR